MDAGIVRSVPVAETLSTSSLYPKVLFAIESPYTNLSAAAGRACSSYK